MARMNLSAYKFQGKNLTPFQKQYNKAISLAWRRIKYMNKKYGISINLPTLPATTDDEEIFKATQRVEKIRTEVMNDPAERRKYIDDYLNNFIDEVCDYLSHVNRTSKYESVNKLREENAKAWADRIKDAINNERQLQGNEGFYNHISQPEVARKIKDIAQIIYELESDNAVQSKATALFNQLLTILHGGPYSVTELTHDFYGFPDEDSFDPYQDAVDVDTSNEFNENLF